MISFRPGDEVVTIRRDGVYDDSPEFADINDDPECAPHTLFAQGDGPSNAERQETLDIRVFFDVSVLEVFVNERVAITTRIYPASGSCTAVRPFATYGSEPVVEEMAKALDLAVWELENAAITYEL